MLLEVVCCRAVIFVCLIHHNLYCGNLEIKKPRRVLAGHLANLLVWGKDYLPEHLMVFSLAFLPFLDRSNAKFCIMVQIVDNGQRNVNKRICTKIQCNRWRPLQLRNSSIGKISPNLKSYQVNKKFLPRYGVCQETRYRLIIEMTVKGGCGPNRFAAGECVGEMEPNWSNLFAVLTHDDHLLQFAPMFVQTAAPRRFRRRRPTYWSGD